MHPRSSFSVDCTVDACKGDVLFFKQDVYKRQNILGKQGTIVGRIVHGISEDATERSNKDTRLMGPVLSSSSSDFKP
ncbi:hypothetical protein Tco_0895679 [Tanacetum coccineum]|uniref:Uncharacterized protein n=1 Tax=Tanacetum coccineum TaxID=301880 RepID=A0ABQ5CI40_9ASTR